jgi:prepilin-type N-terminal cleavage/methylation domain-containing protein
MKNAVTVLQRGFTLVELLIVVIILALLAAIVVPQFASSTDDAKVASLDSTLSNVRAAIDLYYQQHGEYPAANAATTSACTNGTAGTGAANSEAAFLDQLAYYTNASGEACTQQNGGAFPYGPYLKKRELPNNPITEISTLRVVNTGDLNLAGSNPAAGWAFDNVSGKFIADDAVNTDANGNTYDQH